MQTPKTPDEFNAILNVLVTDEEVREMVKQYATEEFRRGYLLGKREMKMAAENAIASVRIEQA